MSTAMKNALFIALTLLFGMILSVIPLPQSIVWWRPAWVFMILFFWITVAPTYVGVISAFFVGLLVDLLSGTLLGFHALVFSLCAFFLLYFYVKINGLPIWQRTLLLAAMLFTGYLLQTWVYELIGVPIGFWHFLLPTLTSSLLWPWIYLLLRDYQQRYEIV